MNTHKPITLPALTVTLTVRASSAEGPPLDTRIARLLKYALRGLGLVAVSVTEDRPAAKPLSPWGVGLAFGEANPDRPHDSEWDDAASPPAPAPRDDPQADDNTTRIDPLSEPRTTQPAPIPATRQRNDKPLDNVNTRRWSRRPNRLGSL